MNSFVLLSSAAFGLPVVQAKASEAVSSANDEVESTNKVKPSSLPLYPETEKLEYTLQPLSQVETLVRDARIQATKVKQDYQPVLDQVCHIISTGKAHTSGAIAQLRDENNLVGRIGFIATGGLLGLIAARRGRFLKKATYLSLGLAGTGSICYPKEAKVYAANVGCFAARNARIAYHFVVGTRPTIQNENGKAFDKMANMVSDVWQWGFRLFERKEPKLKAPGESVSENLVLTESEKSSPENKEEAAVFVTETEQEIKPAEEASSQLDETLAAAAETTTEPKVPSQESSDIGEQTKVPVLEAPTEPAELSAELLTEVPVEQTETSLPEPVKEAQPDADTDSIALPELIAELPVEVPVEQTETPAETSLSEPVKEAQPDADADSTAKPALQLEGDLGQGNPEDKELYTTRE